MKIICSSRPGPMVLVRPEPIGQALRRWAGQSPGERSSTMSDMTGGAASEWRSNWTVVLAGAAGGSLATIHLYSTGVMMAPLEQEFGWSRALISSGVSIVSVVGVILSPFLGMLVDRIGARRVALTGAILFCLFVASLSLATSNEWSW